MEQYFKHLAESDLGEGIAYIEITDEWPTRQVERYGDIWRIGDNDNNKWLADQHLKFLGLDERHIISKQEFEQIWEQAARG